MNFIAKCHFGKIDEAYSIGNNLFMISRIHRDSFHRQYENW